MHSTDKYTKDADWWEAEALCPLPRAPYGPWEYGCNGTGKRRYFVFRTRDSDCAPMQVLSDRRGNYRRFGGPDTARKAADAANRGAQ